MRYATPSRGSRQAEWHRKIWHGGFRQRRYAWWNRADVAAPVQAVNTRLTGSIIAGTLSKSTPAVGREPNARQTWRIRNSHVASAKEMSSCACQFSSVIPAKAGIQYSTASPGLLDRPVKPGDDT